ncbi:MAG: glycosyltransferase family 2 protein [Patescibacteria group bacterium]
MKDLSIVIVTFNEEPEILEECFASVASSTRLNWELLVIDNGNHADTKRLAEAIPNCRYIPNPENKGFAYAVNQGMKLSGGRYALLLNPDTRFAPDVLAKMIQKIDADPTIGIASCVIRYPDGTLQESIRRFPGITDQLLILLKVPHVLKTSVMDRYLMRDADPLQTQDVDSIMGAFMFIRRELMEDIGLFDEQYFLWYEEVDYCKMARQADWRILHVGDVEVTHHKGHAFGKIETLKKQRWVRESLRKYMKKHHGMGAWLLFVILTPIFLVLAYLTALLKRR